MRPVIALDPRLFGRGRRYILEMVERHSPAAETVADLKLFATTFLGAFLFVAVYLA
ncbi:MAG: hypothetical protein ABIO85_05860 [Sphingomicrobium sp.]